jgi:hypothetical protein
MARVSRSKPKKQPARKAARAAPKAKQAPPARKAAAKPKAAAAKPKAAPRKAAAKGARRPARQSHAAEVRALVARPRPGQHPEESQVDHDHHDPRLAGIDQIGAEGDKVQVENYGQFKNKAVARMDKPTNWFRRAAKPKQ